MGSVGEHPRDEDRALAALRVAVECVEVGGANERAVQQVLRAGFSPRLADVIAGVLVDAERDVRRMKEESKLN